MSVRQSIELDEDGNIVIPPTRDETAIREMFHSIQSAKSAIHSAQAELRDEVDRLRAEGVSWSVIGSLLGMSRGGAQKKFSKPILRVSADALRETSLGAPPSARWWSPEGDMVDPHGAELLDRLASEMSDRAVVKHLSRGGPTVSSLDALRYLAHLVRVRAVSLPGRSHSQSERLIRKAQVRLQI